MKTHIASMRSAYFLTNTDASYESWFRVELAPVLEELGVPQASLDPFFAYPEGRQKADLVARVEGGLIVFELKPFVKGAESQKMSDFPGQVERLAGLLALGEVVQVIAFVTFRGYSDGQMRGRLGSFFGGQPWEVVGPELAWEHGKLYLAVAALSR